MSSFPHKLKAGYSKLSQSGAEGTLLGIILYMKKLKKIWNNKAIHFKYRREFLGRLGSKTQLVVWIILMEYIKYRFCKQKKVVTATRCSCSCEMIRKENSIM